MSGSKLALKQWEIKAFYPYVPLWGDTLGGSRSLPLLGATDWIPSQVPGCVQHDLWRAGWIEDPYWGLNSLKAEWVEHRWWMYRTFFDDTAAASNAALHFDGLDYDAYVYLNRQRLGTHTGMFEPAIFDVTGQLNERDNELIVLFKHVPDEMSQIGYTSQTSTQKSRFAYKWDFSTRMVPIGIWQAAYVKYTAGARIADVSIRPVLGSRGAQLHIACAIAAADGDLPNGRWRLTAELSRNGSGGAHLSRDLALSSGEELACELELEVAGAELWYPNGSGAQPLYDVELRIWRDDAVADVWHGATGFCTVSWQPNEDAAPEALPYRLVVNGESVYIKGVNLAPLDQLYGAVSPERYRRLVELLKFANINFVRINGVGIIETQHFYELCDQSGIMVWQDFIQSSSGIDNVPAKDPAFLELLARNATSALKTRRNHISLACWCGGNELMDSDGVPVTYDDANIAMLRALVEQHDPGRKFFPSTASGPIFGLNITQPGRNHDVHGPWKYLGPEEHYRVYNLSDSLFHSEFGADGFSALESLRRFLPADDITLTSMADNVVWRHHGEWWDTRERDVELFGDIADLETLIACSQWAQAEALRYALEANRRRQFNNSGSMPWQFNEPYPNVANTCLVDYYLQPKQAYFWLRNAYADLHASLRYAKAGFQAGEQFEADLFVHNDQAARSVSWRAECFDLDGRSLWTREGCAELAANRATHVATLSMPIESGSPELFAVRVSTTHDRFDESSGVAAPEPNVYLFSTAPAPIFGGLLGRRHATLHWAPSAPPSALGDGQWTQSYRVHNTSDQVALYVRAVTDTSALVLRSPHNYCTLLPGEDVNLAVHWWADEQAAAAPEISFRSW